jgi:hypothetical protein
VVCLGGVYVGRWGCNEIEEEKSIYRRLLAGRVRNWYFFDTATPRPVSFSRGLRV